MEKENNIVYVKTKNGIYKCYKSEQMNKPIYYPVESKTNGFIDYNEVISILSNDDLYNELKKQQEVIEKIQREVDKIFKEYQLFNRAVLLTMLENINNYIKEV